MPQRKRNTIRIELKLPAPLIEELFSLCPELRNPFSPDEWAYGARSKYFTALLREDIARRRHPDA